MSSIRVVLVLRADVEGPHLADGLGLAPGIACDAIGIPQGGWRPARDPETFTVERFGKTWTVTALSADTAASYPAHDGTLPAEFYADALVEREAERRSAEAPR